MPAITHLPTLLATMTPVLRPGVFVFCELPDFDAAVLSALSPVVVVQEDEAVTVVVSQDIAAAHSLIFGPAMRMISLTIHSALEAVGLTAAFATALAEAGVSANVVAGSRHDHIFVPEHQAEEAMTALTALQARSTRQTVANTIVIDAGDESISSCECCGAEIREIKGWIVRGDVDAGTYRVRWCADHLENENTFDLILGDWGETADATDRYAVSVVHRLVDTRPQFLIIDAAEMFAPNPALYGRTMSRAEVVEARLDADIHTYVDQIILQDSRLTELTGGWRPKAPQ